MDIIIEIEKREKKEERRGGGRIGFSANVENGKLGTGALTDC